MSEELQQRTNRDLAFKNEELRRSEDRYHRMIAEVEDYAIILLDVEGKILNWNKGAQSIKGYTAKEIVGHNFSEFYLQDDIDRGLPGKLLEEARLNGKARHEGWRVRNDGRTFWGMIVITALHDNDNNVIGYSKVTRDLTERKVAEERLQRYMVELQYQNEMLQRSEERYHRMIAEVEDYAIILLDRDGNILNWNKGAEAIKGYKENEVIGKNFNIFYLTEDRERNLPQQLLVTAVENNTATHEGWRKRKDGTRFWGSIVITALHDENDKIIGFSKVTRDLTQKKAFEDHILKQNKQLEEYAYVTSHDLQEPLRKINLFSDLLLDKVNSPDAALLLEKIRASATRMTSLIKGVLQYSQVNSDDELKVPINLNQVIDEIEVDFEMMLNDKNGKIERGDLGTIRGIPIQIHQLFSNLISNSIKFNEKNPSVRITAEHFIDDVTKKTFVKITVADNGIGFKPEHSERIFQLFRRLEGEAPGTGIGLALCKRIAEAHGGTISAVSRPGEGSVFEIILALSI
ncbi:MAG: PAS domain S-box protein [Flavobacterium sp.]|nr:PAS domain S-box protein [Flavobacterium sp.]